MQVRNQRDNSGILFKNTRKTQPNHADYTGSVKINDEEFYLNGYIRQGKNGPFLGLTLKPKQQRFGVVQGGRQDFDDSIGF